MVRHGHQQTFTEKRLRSGFRPERVSGHKRDIEGAVFKTGHVTERIKIQFRAEMFNILNHVNYAPFRATAGSSLGLINSTIGAYEGIPGIGPGEPFNTQFSMKVLF